MFLLVAVRNGTLRAHQVEVRDAVLTHGAGGRHLVFLFKTLTFFRNDYVVQKGLIKATAAECCHFLLSPHIQRRFEKRKT
jgi:hypothetical protein